MSETLPDLSGLSELPGLPGAPDLNALPATPRGRYRHYKGGEYEVVGVARHSESLEPMVVYRPLYNDTGWWVRPHAMFFGHIEVEGVERLRFEPMADLAATPAAKTEPAP